MFDMAMWTQYLAQWEDDARRAGATPVDLLDMYYIRQGCLLPRVKVAEIRSILGWESPTEIQTALRQILALLEARDGG